MAIETDCACFGDGSRVGHGPDACPVEPHLGVRDVGLDAQRADMRDLGQLQRHGEAVAGRHRDLALGRVVSVAARRDSVPARHGTHGVGERRCAHLLSVDEDRRSVHVDTDQDLAEQRAEFGDVPAEPVHLVRRRFARVAVEVLLERLHRLHVAEERLLAHAEVEQRGTRRENLKRTLEFADGRLPVLDVHQCHAGLEMPARVLAVGILFWRVRSLALGDGGLGLQQSQQRQDPGSMPRQHVTPLPRTRSRDPPWPCSVAFSATPGAAEPRIAPVAATGIG
jgi:hypothetical protein